MNTTQPTQTSEGAAPTGFRAWLFRTLFPDRATEIATLNATVVALNKCEDEDRSRYYEQRHELREKIQSLHRTIEKLTAVRDAAAAEDRRIPAEQLDAEELAAAFDIEADEDLWRAMHQVLDLAIQGAIEEATMAPGNPAQGKFGAEDRAFAAGGVDFLRDFQRTLIDHRAAARVKAAQAAAEKDTN
jgi:hypothetical protein